jgi:hypothetical protein
MLLCRPTSRRRLCDRRHAIAFGRAAVRAANSENATTFFIDWQSRWSAPVRWLNVGAMTAKGDLV